MSCARYRGDLIELARGASLDAAGRRTLADHVERCANCGAFLEEQRALSAAEERLRQGEIPAADEIGIRVMAEFDRARLLRPARIRPWRWVIAGLAAAALVLAILAPTPPAPVRIAQPVGTGESLYLPIPYTVPLTAGERVEVQRMEIPLTALIAAGFQVGVSDPGAVVQADVLVSQDGRARAIRPLSILNSN